MKDIRRMCAPAPLAAVAALAACSDGAGNSISTGVGGTIRMEYGRVSR